MKLSSEICSGKSMGQAEESPIFHVHLEPAHKPTNAQRLKATKDREGEKEEKEGRMVSLWWGNLSFCQSPCLSSLQLSPMAELKASRIWAFFPRPPSLSARLFAAAAASPSSSSSDDNTEDDGPFLQELLVPAQWTSPQVALQESEWLKKNLHQWLDDEFCPEPANDEISRRCSKVYYYCLLEQQRDMGEILLQMIRELETFSFQKSFHGAFSSANAAIDIITKKIQSLEKEK